MAEFVNAAIANIGATLKPNGAQPNQIGQLITNLKQVLTEFSTLMAMLILLKAISNFKRIFTDALQFIKDLTNNVYSIGTTMAQNAILKGILLMLCCGDERDV